MRYLEWKLEAFYDPNSSVGEGDSYVVVAGQFDYHTFTVFTGNVGTQVAFDLIRNPDPFFLGPVCVADGVVCRLAIWVVSLGVGVLALSGHAGEEEEKNIKSRRAMINLTPK